MERRSPRATSRRIAKTPIICLAAALAVLPASSLAQEYRSSVVGTDFDFILDTDPSTFLCLEFEGKGLREMPDKTRASALVQEAFIFQAYFEDGTSVDMAIDADFETEEAARAEALRYVPRLGKLPTSLRRGVDRMVVHLGEEDATAFSDVGLIVLYSENATKRISTHDLEETVFHEAVHAAWDKQHARSPEWRAAQEADGQFVTRYARENPNGEDLAESALFAYTLVHHPGRIPAAEAIEIRSAIPARIAFVEALLPRNEPIFHQVGPAYACDGTGTTFTTPPPGCDADISLVGVLSDIVSNALMRGLDQEELVVRAFLDGASDRWSTPDELLEATVLEFGFDRATLDAKVQEFLHCNCDHGDLVDTEVVEKKTRPGAAVDAPAGVAAPADRDGFDSREIRSILYLIASLLVLLLVVNACTLFVLGKRAKTAP